MKLPQSTSASGYKHYKCFNNAAVSNSGQGYWECLRVGGTHTWNTGENDKFMLLQICCAFKPGFCYQSCGVRHGYIKIEMGPIGGLVGKSWIILQRYRQTVLAGAFRASIHILTLTPELQGEL